MLNANFIVIATCNCRCCNWEGVHWLKIWQYCRDNAITGLVIVLNAFVCLTAMSWIVSSHQSALFVSDVVQLQNPKLQLLTNCKITKTITVPPIHPRR